MQDISRRHFVVAGLGLVAASCTRSERLMTARPRPLWPVSENRPHVDGQVMTLPPPDKSVAAPVGPIMAYPRDRWAKAMPIRKRLQAMGGIRRITVHHEGSTPVWFTDLASTAQRLEAIRASHLNRLNAGDIGYHLIVDRAGRVWQGRDLRYQGAHVRDHNANNIGIMVLGNFDLQRPTDVQLTTLRRTVGKLMHQYDLATQHVFTHQEFNVTSCPGKSLQNRMVALRRGDDLLIQTT